MADTIGAKIFGTAYAPDLQWDNYDDPQLDAGTWLRSLNCLLEEGDCARADGRKNFYEKVFTYAGNLLTLSGDDFLAIELESGMCVLRGYCQNDGFVPLQSAEFLDSFNLPRGGANIVYTDCDHHEMASGACGDEGRRLFNDIATDLLR